MSIWLKKGRGSKVLSSQSKYNPAVPRGGDTCFDKIIFPQMLTCQSYNFFYVLDKVNTANLPRQMYRGTCFDENWMSAIFAVLTPVPHFENNWLLLICLLTNILQIWGMEVCALQNFKNKRRRCYLAHAHSAHGECNVFTNFVLPSVHRGSRVGTGFMHCLANVPGIEHFLAKKGSCPEGRC